MNRERGAELSLSLSLSFSPPPLPCLSLFLSLCVRVSHDVQCISCSLGVILGTLCNRGGGVLWTLLVKPTPGPCSSQRGGVHSAGGPYLTTRSSGTVPKKENQYNVIPVLGLPIQTHKTHDVQTISITQYIYRGDRTPRSGGGIGVAMYLASPCNPPPNVVTVPRHGGGVTRGGGGVR